MPDKPIRCSHRVLCSIWAQVELLLPPSIPGRPSHGRMDDRKILEAVLHMLCEDCVWEDVPDHLGSTGTLRERFQEWQNGGVFQRMWLIGLLSYEEMRRLVWHGKPMDPRQGNTMGHSSPWEEGEPGP